LELNKKHLGLIEFQLSTFDVDQNVEDDLRSAGNFGLLNALRTYPDTGNTAKFETFAVTCIRNAMLDELKHISVRNRAITRAPMDEELDDESVNPEDRVLNKEKATLAWRRVRSILPDLTPRQVWILAHRIHCASEDEETQQEIASRFKCHQSTIQREEKKLYDNLRKAS
jgi:RNA polymerase sigma factor (sigma-70 family)